MPEKEKKQCFFVFPFFSPTTLLIVFSPTMLPIIAVMFRFVTIFAFLASVAAFAPMGRVASSSMKMAFAQGLPGADGYVAMEFRTNKSTFCKLNFPP